MTQIRSNMGRPYRVYKSPDLRAGDLTATVTSWTRRGCNTEDINVKYSNIIYHRLQRMCKIELMPASSGKSNADTKGYPRPSSTIERNKTNQSLKDCCCQKKSSSNDIRNNLSSPRHAQIHDRHISSESGRKTAAGNPVCSCKDITASKGLQGNKLRAFYKVWTMKDTGKHAVKHRVLERPAAWKRSEQYRSCGCATRSHLNSLGLQSVNLCRCGKISMSPN